MAGMVASRSKVALTAVASTGVPSLKVGPDRSTKVNRRSPSATENDDASHGMIAPVLGSWPVSESTSERLMSIVVSWLVCCGSRQVGSTGRPTCRVPPVTGALASVDVFVVLVEHAMTEPVMASRAVPSRIRGNGLDIFYLT